MAAFTGARMEEICRLKHSDVGYENGIMYIFIRSDEKNDHTLKTASSRR